MKMTFNGIEIEVPPQRNPFGSDYVYREVVKETEKAYMIKTNYNGKFGAKTIFQWIGKSVCKIDENGDVFCPHWLVDEGIGDKYWTTIATKQ